jgi:hypothetical protein
MRKQIKIFSYFDEESEAQKAIEVLKELDIHPLLEEIYKKENKINQSEKVVVEIKAPGDRLETIRTILKQSNAQEINQQNLQHYVNISRLLPMAWSNRY